MQRNTLEDPFKPFKTPLNKRTGRRAGEMAGKI
jgi:hypothetical protein